jgi:hypothetical protein
MAANASLLLNRASATSCTPSHGVPFSPHCCLKPIARKSIGTAAECVRLSTWENTFSASKSVSPVSVQSWCRMSYGSSEYVGMDRRVLPGAEDSYARKTQSGVSVGVHGAYRYIAR